MEKTKDLKLWEILHSLMRKGRAYFMQKISNIEKLGAKGMDDGKIGEVCAIWMQGLKRNFEG